MVRVVATVRPGTEGFAVIQASSMSGGAVGAASCCRVVCAYSSMPLAEEASTGTARPLTAGRFSSRYRPETSRLFSPSSLASAAGSIAAMSTGTAR